MESILKEKCWQLTTLDKAIEFAQEGEFTQARLLVLSTGVSFGEVTKKKIQVFNLIKKLEREQFEFKE